MEATTHLFLAVRFNCNKCHDHPFERWTQDQYYQTAAYFARVELKPDPASGKRKIEGTSVESDKPLYEIIGDKSQGEVVHDRTKAVAAPKFPFAVDYPHRRACHAPPGVGRLAHRGRRTLTSPRATSTGCGAICWARASSSPWTTSARATRPRNPDLLDYLTREFIEHHFDMRHMLRLICRSRTYQLSIDVQSLER